MWLVECFEYVQTFKQLVQTRFGSKDTNENIDRIFAITMFFLFSYLIYDKIAKALLRSKKIPSRFHQEISYMSFNMTFSSCCLSFLILYHTYFIFPELSRQSTRNSLFYQPCESELVKFKIITFILGGFRIFGSIMDLKSQDVSKAISKVLYVVLLMICHENAYENYSIVLNINLTCFHMFSDLLSILAIRFQSDKDPATLRTLAAFKIICWIYIFLNFLPFQYMLPTLYTKNAFLIISFVSWYASEVWTSPLLQALYHQLFHLSINECPGENSLTRCLMLKDSSEWKHFNRLNRALIETKLHHQRHQLNKLNLSESAASAKTFQTIKCVMTLKRKLKKIRENRKQQ